MRFRPAVYCWLLCCCLPANAADIRHIDVTVDDDTFHLYFEVDLNASQVDVYKLITDYPQLTRLNDMVLESRVIKDDGYGLKTRQLLMYTCILFFCKKIHVVETMQENGQDEILATIIPSQSDFVEGTSHWQVTEETPGRARILLESRVRPDFWIPPLIGPWLLKIRMQHELTTMSQRIESLVNNDEY